MSTDHRADPSGSWSRRRTHNDRRVSRTIASRAERIVARLIHQEEFDNSEVLRYLNRLSSLLFVLARYEEAASGVTSVTLAKQDIS